MSLNIKFGVTTWLWTSPFTTEDRYLFDKISSIGFDTVEIAVEDPLLVDVSKVKAALDETGLQPVVCAAFGTSRDLTHNDPSYHKTSLDYIKACFDVCNGLGASFVAGPMYSSVGKARMVSNDQRQLEWERAVTNLRKVCEIAGARGLSIAIEPLNRFETDLINTAASVMKLIHDIDHPSAGVMLDSFHMNIEETDMEQAVKKVGNKLLHVQVSENNRGVPGTGQTQWKSLYRGLKSIDYNGAVAIESFSPNIQELAGAVCTWKSLANSQDDFAHSGLSFLQHWARGY